MGIVALTFLASASTGATAGLWRLGIWWRFVAMLAVTGLLWAAVAASLFS